MRRELPLWTTSRSRRAGEDMVLFPDQKSFRISITNSSNLGTKTGTPRVDTAPYDVETPTTLDGC